MQPMFTEAFAEAKIQKQPKCPPRDEWIENVWRYIYIYTHTHRKNELVAIEERNLDLCDSGKEPRGEVC